MKKIHILMISMVYMINLSAMPGSVSQLVSSLVGLNLANTAKEDTKIKKEKLKKEKKAKKQETACIIEDKAREKDQVLDGYDFGKSPKGKPILVARYREKSR